MITGHRATHDMWKSGYITPTYSSNSPQKYLLLFFLQYEIPRVFASFPHYHKFNKKKSLKKNSS